MTFLVKPAPPSRPLAYCSFTALKSAPVISCLFYFFSHTLGGPQAPLEPGPLSQMGGDPPLYGPGSNWATWPLITTLRAFICAHQSLDQVLRRNSQFCHSDMSHWESRICIENEKLQKRKTSAPGKIQYLGAHVFGNAKLFLVFRILDSQISKCFFTKPLIATHLSKKNVKTHVKMVAGRWNLNWKWITHPVNLS